METLLVWSSQKQRAFLRVSKVEGKWQTWTSLKIMLIIDYAQQEKYN